MSARFNSFVVVSALVLACPALAHSAEAPMTAEEIRKETERLRAETERINAEAERIRAQRAREALDAPTDTTLADLKRAEEVALAQEKVAKAETGAKIAAEIGEVKAATYSGAVDLKEKSGTVEAMLLATKAVNGGAAKLVQAIDTTITSGKNVIVLPGRSFQSFQRLTIFEFRRQLVARALLGVLEPAKPAATPDPNLPPAAGAAAGAAVVSAGLDALSKLLSYLKTDYTIGGVDTTIDEAVAIYAVAGALADKNKAAFVPTTFMPSAQAAAVEALSQQMGELVALRARVEALRSKTSTEAATRETVVAGETEADKKKRVEEAAELRRKEAACQAALAAYDSFAASLTTPDTPGGAIPLLALANDFALRHQVGQNNSQVLLVRLEATGGGYMLKKNLWTGLGAVPLYHMGGAALSYLLLDGATGQVLKGGSLAVHGGFVKSKDLPTHLAN